MAKLTLDAGFLKGPDVKILQAALNALPTEYAMLIVTVCLPENCARKGGSPFARHRRRWAR